MQTPGQEFGATLSIRGASVCLLPRPAGIVFANPRYICCARDLRSSTTSMVKSKPADEIWRNSVEKIV